MTVLQTLLLFETAFYFINLQHGLEQRNAKANAVWGLFKPAFEPFRSFILIFFWEQFLLVTILAVVIKV